MEDLISFDDEPKKLPIEAPDQLLAIQDDPFAPDRPIKKIKKEPKEETKNYVDGEDLIDFSDENRMDNLIDFGDGNDDVIQLDHDSDDDDENEDEFGPIEPGQKRILVAYNDLKFPVNWYEDTPLSDVREMVI